MFICYTISLTLLSCAYIFSFIFNSSLLFWVGSSGCGKSTLIRLLYRFYDPKDGKILIGGKDIRDYKLDSIRKAIAVVPQDTILFNESIGYNIHYGNLNASWDEVMDAAKKARIHESIVKMPQGYQTIVGERGLKLSGMSMDNVRSDSHCSVLINEWSISIYYKGERSNVYRLLEQYLRNLQSYYAMNLHQV